MRNVNIIVLSIQKNNSSPFTCMCSMASLDGSSMVAMYNPKANTVPTYMCLTKPTSELRHSFTATLVKPAVSHRGFPFCDAGALVSKSQLCDL